jgi:predicted small lipoprotein YifL
MAVNNRVGGYRAVTDWLATGRPLSRRRVLAAATALAPVTALASCGVPNPLAGPPGPSPDVRTLRASISTEQSLIDAYRGVLAAFPALSGSLRTFLSQHEEHLGQLNGRLIVPPHVSASPSPSPSAPATAGPPPASPSAAIATLGAAERDAAAAQVGRLGTTEASLAQLLASIAASEATHAAVLSGLQPAGGA